MCLIEFGISLRFLGVIFVFFDSDVSPRTLAGSGFYSKRGVLTLFSESNDALEEVAESLDRLLVNEH